MKHTGHIKHILETTQFPQQGQLTPVGQTDDSWSLTIPYVQQICHSQIAGSCWMLLNVYG